MKVRVLGCSGAIAKDCRTTSFLIDDSILIDAGTGVGDLTLDEMRKIDHVFLTHSHLDHIAALPLMLDAVSSLRTKPVQIYALQATIDALQSHVFNNLIWPDFGLLPSPEQPLLRYCAISVGQQTIVGGRLVEALPAVHSVPAVGYGVRGDAGWWAFSGDTGRNPGFWAWVNTTPICLLFVETAFSNKESELALRSQHLSPDALAQELGRLRIDRTFPIYISHTKPTEAPLIMEEIAHITPASHGSVTRRLQPLLAGQVFEV